jgi:hypothetical protein
LLNILGIPFASTSSPSSIPMILRFHLLMESVSPCIFFSQVLSCLTNRLSSAFPAFVYWKFMWRSALWASPFLWCTFSNSAPLLCVGFQFLVYCSVLFCFLAWGGQSAQGTMLG